MDKFELRVGSVVFNTKSNSVVYFTAEDFKRIEDFEPVKLTTEKLLQYGFTERKGCYSHDKFNIVTFGESFYCNTNGVLIPYVHRLQGLFYELNRYEIGD